MIFNKFQGTSLSALGMGCMRLPIDEKTKEINLPKAREMIAYAIQNGINYFDTAWGYHNGQSEPVMGEILSEYPRQSFYLASKFPGYDVSNMDKVEEIFEKQLKRCRVDYFDFYLFHTVCEANIEYYLDRKYGIYDYLCQQKKNGRIKHLGFSVHGNTETTLRFLDAYGDAMEFAQVQLNWLDWDFQNAKEKIQILKDRNIPVWVMEPVRGGKLANLQPKYERVLRVHAPERSNAEWCFRYLQSIPTVTLTLSGMSSFEQLKENIKTFSTHEPLTDNEISVLYDIAHHMTSVGNIPCTSCKYCTEHCPMELDIPRLIELYNKHNYTEDGFIAPMAIGALPDGQKPSACIGCRACEELCPQSIKISEIMSDFSSRLCLK